MKCLRIKDNKGEFSLNAVQYSSIDEITKDDILALIDIALDPDQELDMDEFSPDTLKNSAHMVIYSSLYERFSELKINKERFVTETNERYQEAYDKYKLQEPENDDERNDQTQHQQS